MVLGLNVFLYTGKSPAHIGCTVGCGQSFFSKKGIIFAMLILKVLQIVRYLPQFLSYKKNISSYYAIFGFF